MRKYLLASAAAFLISGTAMAADLPARAPAIAPAPIFVSMNWTGFYVGAQIGYSWGQNRACEYLAGVLTANGCRNISTDGLVGGLHAGYNVQMGRIVLGVEADVEASGKRGSLAGWGPGPLLPLTVSVKNEWQGSLRARVGYAFDRALLYVTGGVAVADWKYSYSDPGLPVVTRFSGTRTGWTVGAGLEYAFTNNWTARAEYRYTDWGNVSHAPGALSGRFSPFTYRHSNTDHTVRIGLSYLFSSSPGAVVAKY